MKNKKSIFLILLFCTLCGCNDYKVYECPAESVLSESNSSTNVELDEDFLAAYKNKYTSETAWDIDIESYGMFQQCEVFLIRQIDSLNTNREEYINQHYFKYESHQDLGVYYNKTLYSLHEASWKYHLLNAEDVQSIYEKHVENFPELYKQYTFKELFDIPTLKVEDICKVYITSYPGTIVPPWFNEVYYIEDQTYFLKVMEYLKQVRFLEISDCFDGIGGTSISICSTTGTVHFDYSNHNEFYINNHCYVASLDFPIYSEKMSEKSFYLTGCFFMKFISFDTISELDSNYMDNLYFVIDEQELDYIPLTKDAIISFGDRKMYINSNKSFYMEGKYYKIIGETDFSELLKNVSSTSSYVTILDENQNEIFKYKVTNHVEYTDSELYPSITENMALYKEDGTIFQREEINEDLTLTIKVENQCNLS